MTRADRHEPGVQRTYAEMARHYDTAIVPAGPRKPRDKARVEVGVQVAQRWILARLRNETFFSLAALNERIAELLEELNARPMKKLGGATRRERYDRPVLRALPSQRAAIHVFGTAAPPTPTHGMARLARPRVRRPSPLSRRAK